MRQMQVRRGAFNESAEQRYISADLLLFRSNSSLLAATRRPRPRKSPPTCWWRPRPSKRLDRRKLPRSCENARNLTCILCC